MLPGLHAHLTQIQLCLPCPEGLCKRTSASTAARKPSPPPGHHEAADQGTDLRPSTCNRCVTEGSIGLTTGLIVPKQPLGGTVGWPDKGFPGGSVVKNSTSNAEDARDVA